MIPFRFSSMTFCPSFIPHVTLTSDISPLTYGGDPQSWLESIDMTSCSEATEISMQNLNVEQPFHRKLTITVNKSLELSRLATILRAAAAGPKPKHDIEYAERWEANDYRPHLSLL